mgnify:CR=1 FL=1
MTSALRRRGMNILHMLMLGDELKERTRKNALTSLKDTLRNSPIGWLLGQGEFEMKGKQILSITKKWMGGA